jgi:putative oxidoreductase
MTKGIFYTRKIAAELIVGALAFLFLYAGCSKLMDMGGFAAAMALQPVAGWLKQLLATALPYAEIIIALGLLFYRSRRYALYLYALLMLLFTGYSGLALFHFFKTVPCSCGGIIDHLGWKAHFILNLFFTVLTIVALALHPTRPRVVHHQEVS